MAIRKLIEEKSSELTASERKLSAAILSDYPFAGLAPIQVLAERSNVSAASISRFVNKLGYKGLQDFQQALINELKEGQKSPLDLHTTQISVEGNFLSGFMQRTEVLLHETAKIISQAQFESVCSELSNEKRSLFLIGGRMSDALAQYLARHLRQYRSNVFHLPSDPEAWPEYLLRMKPRDILFVIDFRRYQKPLEELATAAVSQRSAQVMVMTDKWLSPCAQCASEVLPIAIENGTVWDSYAAALALTEAMITRITTQNWEQTSDRIKAWDAMRSNFGEDNDS